MEKVIDDRRVLAIPGDKDETIGICLLHFIQNSLIAINDHGKYYVALSGGSTPKALFHALSQAPFKDMVEWDKVHLFWSDERSVGPDHPDSNYKMAMDAGLAGVGIPKNQIHRVEGEKEAQTAALEYESTIKSVLGSRSFDLVMLGMGEDGHTASLFPGTEGLKVQDKLFIANQVPQKETVRLTMTFDAINSAENIVFYVIGAGKQEMLKNVLSGNDYPATHVGTPEHKALWIADNDAAKLFLES